jgi:hypothetical protein
VDVNLTSEGRAKLQLGDSVAFSYEVVWKTSDTKFEVRVNEKESARKEVYQKYIRVLLKYCTRKMQAKAWTRR